MGNNPGLELLIRNLIYAKDDFTKSIAYTRLELLGYTNETIIEKAIELGFLKRGE